MTTHLGRKQCRHLMGWIHMGAWFRSCSSETIYIEERVSGCVTRISIYEIKMESKTRQKELGRTRKEAGLHVCRAMRLVTLSTNSKIGSRSRSSNRSRQWTLHLPHNLCLSHEYPHGLQGANQKHHHHRYHPVSSCAQCRDHAYVVLRRTAIATRRRTRRGLSLILRVLRGA